MLHLNDQTLSLLLDGELPPAEQSAAAGHVAQCAACQQAVRQYKLLGDMIRSAPLPEPNIAAQARWLNGFRPARDRGARDRGVRTLASILTAAAAIVIAVTMAVPSSAQATAAPADWERVAVAGSSDVSQTPQGTAQWIVADLSVGGAK